MAEKIVFHTPSGFMLRPFQEVLVRNEDDMERNSGGIMLTQGINRVPHSLDPDYRDAAEFEARVGELLAQKEGTWEPCCYGKCLYGMVVNVATCGQCRMKHARLVVEAEMEREEA